MHKTSMHTDHVRDTKNSIHVPIMNDRVDSENVGRCIGCFLDKLAISAGTESRDPITGKLESVYADLPIGRNGISKLVKDGANILGLHNHDSFSPHSLCPYFITKLANGNGVRDRKIMASACHTSLGASAIYQERDGGSESNKFVVLGINPLKRQKIR